MKTAQQKGISAVNQDFKKYEQVRKNQSYLLAEHENLEDFDEDYQIKTCDLNQYFNGGEAGSDSTHRVLERVTKQRAPVARPPGRWQDAPTELVTLRGSANLLKRKSEVGIYSRLFPTPWVRPGTGQPGPTCAGTGRSIELVQQYQQSFDCAAQHKATVHITDY